MKKLTKSIITSILCAVIAITAIATANTTTAYAASDKVPVKVTFKGKTVTLTKDLNKEKACPKIKTLKSKWGKPTEQKECYDEYTDETLKTANFYRWIKGKSNIFYNVQIHKLSLGGSARTYIQINSEDKNIKINGIKVGMSQKEARKILKSFSLEKENYTDSSDQIFSDGGSIACMYENGKVSQIAATIEYLEDYE